MTIKNIIKGMAVARYLDMIEYTEKHLEMLRDGLAEVVYPEVYEDACDECRADEVADRLELN